jgi:hypothetical protein
VGSSRRVHHRLDARPVDVVVRFLPPQCTLEDGGIGGSDRTGCRPIGLGPLG